MAEIAGRRRRRSAYTTAPAWVTRRRAISVVLIVAIGWAGTYAFGIGQSIARLTHQGLPGTIGNLVGGLAHKIGNGGPADSIPRTNVALYGYGGGNHDGAYLSDSIMIVSIEKQPGHPVQVAEMSVPRDWYVPMDLGGGQTVWGRINEAYSSGISGTPHSSSQYSGRLGGGQLADATIEKLLGIHIDHFVGIDFHAFQSVVDDVGGVDINVEHAFVDTQYPSDSCENGPNAPCYDTTVRFAAGMQHMDGKRALVYTRSRHAQGIEGSDFARSRRQQLIIQSLKSKASGFGLLTNGASILSSLSEHIITDITDIAQFSDLYDTLKAVDTTAVERISIDDQNFLYECSYPTECRAAYIYPHDTSHATLHHFSQNVIPDPRALVEKVPVTVEDGSGYGADGAARWASLLAMQTFAATDGGRHRFTDTTQVVDSSGGKGAKTAQWLASYFGVSVTTIAPLPGAVAGVAADGAAVPSPSPTAPGGTGGVTLVLGADEERAFHSQTGAFGTYDSGGGGGYSTYTPTHRPPATPRRQVVPTFAARSQAAGTSGGGATARPSATMP